MTDFFFHVCRTSLLKVQQLIQKKKKKNFLCINVFFFLYLKASGTNTQSVCRFMCVCVCVCEALRSPDCCFWRAAEPRSASPGREPHKEQQLTCTDLSSVSPPNHLPIILSFHPGRLFIPEVLGPARRAAVWSWSRRRRNADERFCCRPHWDVNDGL